MTPNNSIRIPFRKKEYDLITKNKGCLSYSTYAKSILFQQMDKSEEKNKFAIIMHFTNTNILINADEIYKPIQIYMTDEEFKRITYYKTTTGSSAVKIARYFIMPLLTESEV